MSQFCFYLWLSIIPLYICTKSTLSSPVDGYLGCLHVLAIVNSVAMNTEVHVSFQIIVLSGYMPRSGIARSYSSSVLSFLKKLHTVLWGFPGGLVVKNLPAMQETQEEWVRSLGRVRCPRVRWVRCPGGGNANPLQYSCQENPTDRGAWQATVHRVTRSRTQLK